MNPGSSTLKLSLVDGAGDVLETTTLPVAHGQGDPDEIEAAVESPALRGAEAVAHRVVHGGTRFTQAVVLSAEVTGALWDLAALAPLHQRQGLKTMATISRLLPQLPAVACFDTAFHATIPDAAATYALPQSWRDRWDLRRHGFHGLSHGSVARAFEHGRVVSCHLGAGASLCAVSEGVSIDTTMGLTPMAGLVMAHRPGDVDPGLLLWLLRETDLSVDTVEAALEHDSGLRGLTGTADMRAVVAGDESGDERCMLGLAVYVHRLCAGIASMAAALGGIDTLVFTGGVGEHAPAIRAKAARRLGFLGVALDPAKNLAADGDTRVSTQNSRVDVHVVTAREDVEMARQTRHLLAS